jgi:hypothetical protein
MGQTVQSGLLEFGDSSIGTAKLEEGVYIIQTSAGKSYRFVKVKQ